MPLIPFAPGGPVALWICLATSFLTSALSDGPPSAGAAIASVAIAAIPITRWLHLTLRFILDLHLSPVCPHPAGWSSPTATVLTSQERRASCPHPSPGRLRGWPGFRPRPRAGAREGGRPCGVLMRERTALRLGSASTPTGVTAIARPGERNIRTPRGSLGPGGGASAPYEGLTLRLPSDSPRLGIV